jgi:hypothetical protein
VVIQDLFLFARGSLKLRSGDFSTSIITLNPDLLWFMIVLFPPFPEMTGCS